MPEISNRILTTVLSFDMTSAGSQRQDFLDQSREILQLYGGKELEMGNSRFNAIFDGPGRAVRCAWAIRELARRLELMPSIGLHAGECEIRGATLEGAAFQIAANLAAVSSGEILVSRTIMDLVAGSGIKFENFAIHTIDESSEGIGILKVLAV